MKIAEYINYKILRAAILLVLFFVSCTAATLQANVNINPVSLSFGSQSIGTTSKPIKMTLTNASGHDIVVSLSGTGVQAQPLVTIQPASETVITGQTATFSASVSGATPVGYQWMKNGAAISGATAAGYTTPPATTSDNAAQFTV